MSALKSSTTYSTESGSTEFYQPPTCVNRCLTVSFFVQLAILLAIVILSASMMFMCRETQLVGFTMIIAAAVFILQVAAICSLGARHRCYPLIIAATLSVCCLCMLINEFSVWYCAHKSFAQTSFCLNFRLMFNFCKFIRSEAKSETSASPYLISTSTKVTADKGFNEKQTALFYLALASFIFCIIFVILLIVSVRHGRPVFLNRKRHRRSIVVGHKDNPKTANQHLKQNLILGAANVNESQRYDIIRSAFESASPISVRDFLISEASPTSTPSKSYQSKSSFISNAQQSTPEMAPLVKTPQLKEFDDFHLPFSN